MKSCQAKYIVAVDTDTTNPFRIYLINTSTGSGLSSIWRFSDGDSVNGTGLHNFTKFGKYEVCLEVSNSNCTDEFCDSIGMDSLGNLYKKEGFTIVMLDEEDIKTNVNEARVDNSSVYPNPFTNTCKVVMRDQNRMEAIQLIDMKGKAVLSAIGIDATQYDIDASYLSSGIYYLKILTTEGEVLNKKLIKQ